MARFKCVDEQHVVFQMDVLHQVITKLQQPAIQGTPGVAGVGRRSDVVGQREQPFQCFAMLIMFKAQHLDRRCGLRADALLQHREQHLFFLEHVAFKFLLHVGQEIGQAVGATAAGTMDLLDAAGQTNQFRQLFAMACVVARQKMGDQQLRGFVAPVVLGFAGVLQLVQRIGNQSRIEAFASGRFKQAFMPATTEVQFEGCGKSAWRRECCTPVGRGFVPIESGSSGVPCLNFNGSPGSLHPACHI